MVLALAPKISRMEHMRNENDHLEAIRNVLLTVVLTLMTVGVIRTIIELL